MTTQSNAPGSPDDEYSLRERLGVGPVDPTIIKTSRLELRAPHPSDAPALFRNYTADRDVTKYLTWAPHTSVDDTKAFIASRIAKWQSGDACSWAISLDSHPGPIGMIELRLGDGSIGFVLGRAWWNRGIMSEALQGLVNHARIALRIKTLSAWCDAENRGSARVLEKNGFSLERTGLGPLPHSGFGGEIRPALFYILYDGC